MRSKWLFLQASFCGIGLVFGVFIFLHSAAARGHVATAPRDGYETVEISSDAFTCVFSKCTTPLYETDETFQTSVVSMLDENRTLRIRFRDSGSWTPWIDVQGEADQRDGVDDARSEQLFFLNRADAFQLERAAGTMRGLHLIFFTAPRSTSSTVRIALEAEGPDQIVPGSASVSSSEQVSLPATLVPSAGVSSTDALQSQPSSPAPTILPIVYQDPVIVSRAEWLPQSFELPLETREKVWPSQYDEVKKIILHHTATIVRDLTGDASIDRADYQEALRGIYHYHTKIQKWGDIGYQYLIDPMGTVWEGRSGGDGIVGGHAFRDRLCKKFGAAGIGFNKGTIGIAILGTFQSENPSVYAHDALTSLIAKKAWEFGFEPAGSSTFIDQEYQNIIGHRDVDCTTCPGDSMYGSLDSIRANAQEKYQQYMREHPRSYRAELVSTVPRRLTMQPGSVEKILFQYRNTGTVSWRNYGENKTQLVGSEIKSHLASLESLRLAVDGSQSTTTEALLHDIARAQLLTPNVAPGEIGTFELTIQEAPNELLAKKQFVLAVGDRGWLGTSDASLEIENNGLPLAALRIDPEETFDVSDDRPAPITLIFENKGTAVWERGHIFLSLEEEDGSTPRMRDKSWKAKHGDFPFQEKRVKPGEYATFRFIVAPKKEGALRLNLHLWQDTEKLSGSDYHPLGVNVTKAFRAQVHAAAFPEHLLNTWGASGSVLVENTGFFPWDRATLRMTGNDGKSLSAFRHQSWKDARTITELHSIEPGESVLILFDAQTPRVRGVYTSQLAFSLGKKTIPLETDGVLRNSIEVVTRVEVEPKEKKQMKKTVNKKAFPKNKGSKTKK